jgi:acyl-CoA thioester hydrolase
MSSTAYRHPIGIDAADIDFMGHVNNAAYLKWVQEAVVGHWQKLAPAKRSQSTCGSR